MYFFQNNEWVDSVMMRDIARKFFAHKNEVHGEGVWLIIFCDNLSAHLDPEAKNLWYQQSLLVLPSPKHDKLHPVNLYRTWYISAFICWEVP